MNDFERRLGDALKNERDRDEARAHADLPRIKGAIMERIHGRNRLTMFAAAAATAVAVIGVLTVPQLVRGGGDGPPPVGTTTSPSPESSPTEPPDTVPFPPDRCFGELPFQPIVVPEGFTYELRSGSGGDPAASDPEGSGLYGHYRGAERGRYVDVYAEGFGPGAGASDVELLSERILGRRGGAFTRIHEGFAVTFRAAGCGYSLQAYGVTERDLKELATNLAFTQKGARGRLDAFAVWPEVQVQDAVEACRAAVGGFDQGWRLDRRAVAAEFVDETLGWSEPSIERSTVGYAVAESLDELPTVGVVVSDPVAPGCYSVTSVGGTSEGSPGLLSFSSGQGSFEFMAYGPGLDYFEVEVPVTRIEATITFGSRAPVTRTFEAPFRKRSEVPLGSDISTSGAYLIVFKGPAGEVMGASGGALPPYDTAAG